MLNLLPKHAQLLYRKRITAVLPHYRKLAGILLDFQLALEGSSLLQRCRYTIVLAFSIPRLQRLLDILLSHVNEQHAQSDVVALVVVVQPLPALLLVDWEVY